MSVEALIKAGWNEHGDSPQAVAERLAASTHLVQAPEQVAPYAQLVTHVYGEHLGQWERGTELLQSLRELALDHVASGTRAVNVGIATLRYAGGNPAALDALSTDESVSALANAASALAARDDVTRAIDSYAAALRAAGAGLPADSPANRALAVGGNNLAAALETRPGRSAYETKGMLTAAEGGLQYWKKVGTWLEEERAEYRLARSRLQAGQAAAAVRSAQRCLQVCESNAAPPFELFFAHAVLALAHRANGDRATSDTHRQQAMAAFSQVPEPDRRWCDSDRREMEG